MDINKHKQGGHTVALTFYLFSKELVLCGVVDGVGYFRTGQVLD